MCQEQTSASEGRGLGSILEALLGYCSRGPANSGEGGETHSDTCTKMSSDPFSGVMKPWPCERENCLQTPLNTGPAEARAVLKIG